MARLIALYLVLFPLAVSQQAAKGGKLSAAETKEVYALAAEYLSAETWEAKQKIAVKLEAYKPNKADLDELAKHCMKMFRKNGPAHAGKLETKCGHPKYPGKYLVALPPGVQPGNPKGPKVGLFVALHGGGAGQGDGSQIQGLFGTPSPKMITVYPSVVEKTDGAWQTAREESYVLAVIDELKRAYNIDTNRMYMGGHSMGGGGTWSIGGHHADLFAALTSMAGTCLVITKWSGQVTGLDCGVLTNTLNTPIWFYHSDDDPQVPIADALLAGEAMRKLKEKYGPYDYVWKHYKDIGHGIPKDGLRPIFDWMLKKTRDPLPKHILWEPGRVYKRHFFWLRKDPSQATSSSNLGQEQIEATREGNKITLAGSRAGLTILLNDQMVDFSKPVVVDIGGGRELFNGKVEYSAAALVESFDARHDPEMLFTAWIRLDQPTR